MDVTGIEPATPCLQRKLGKTLNALPGVAYTENRRDFRLSDVPKLSRELNCVLARRFRFPHLIKLRRWIGERAAKDVTIAESRGAVLLWRWPGQRAT